MQLAQAVQLIQHEIKNEQTIYADLGCGDGLFTYALSQMLAPASVIYAVDKNQKVLNQVSVDDMFSLKKLILILYMMIYRLKIYPVFLWQTHCIM